MKWFEDDSTIFNAKNERERERERGWERVNAHLNIFVHSSYNILFPLPVVCEELVLCEYCQILVGVTGEGEEIECRTAQHRQLLNLDPL